MIAHYERRTYTVQAMRWEHKHPDAMRMLAVLVGGSTVISQDGEQRILDDKGQTIYLRYMDRPEYVHRRGNFGRAAKMNVHFIRAEGDYITRASNGYVSVHTEDEFNALYTPAGQKIDQTDGAS